MTVAGKRNVIDKIRLMEKKFSTYIYNSIRTVDTESKTLKIEYFLIEIILISHGLLQSFWLIIFLHVLPLFKY